MRAPTLFTVCFLISILRWTAVRAEGVEFTEPDEKLQDNSEFSRPFSSIEPNVDEQTLPVDRRLGTSGPFISSELPAGTGLEIELHGGQKRSAVQGMQIDLLAGEVILGLKIVLPTGYLFNVAGARLRAVVGDLTRQEARSGECAIGKLGPANNQLVESPFSDNYGAETANAQGADNLAALLGKGAAFTAGGRYRICFSSDGSYAASHSDLVEVVLNVQAFVTSRLPAGVGLQVYFEAGYRKIVYEGGHVLMSTGDPIVKFTLHLPNNSVLDAGAARLKAVHANVTRNLAVNGGACAATSPFVTTAAIVDMPLSGPGVSAKHSRGDNTLDIHLEEPVAFRLGGLFRLCYSDDGSFSQGHVDLLDVLLKVDGVLSNCDSQNCLAARSFRCYSLLGRDGPAGNCVLPIEGILGKLGRASWSRRIFENYAGDGRPLSSTKPSCGSFAADPEAFCAESNGSSQMCDGRNRSVSLVMRTEVVLPPTRALTLSQEARTNAICYCTGVEGCDVPNGQTGFYQQIGLVQLFTASVMTSGEYSCATSSTGVLASIPFVACVYCPPGGCPFNDNASKILFSRQAEPWTVEALPTWSPQHSCRSATHETFLLPPAEVASKYDGGPRSDTKRFRPDGGYSLPNFPAFVPKGSLLDICFCVAQCGHGENGDWFKVGQVAVLDSSMSVAANVPGKRTTAPPRQVGQVGQLSITRSLMPYQDPVGVVGLSAGGGLRLASMIISEDSSTRDACIKGRPVAVIGPNRANTSDYSGTIRGDRIVFDGGVEGRNLSFPAVATVVVCYCPQPGQVDTDETKPTYGEQLCSDSPYWIPVGALVIAGPIPNQRWILPTFKIIRFEYLGVDLGPSDNLRLIDQFQNCEDFPSAAEMCTGYKEDKVNGHLLCDRTDLTVRTGFMPTTTLAWNRVGCNEVNANCKAVPIVDLQTTSNGLMLQFADTTYSPGGLGDLGLKEDDTIVLGSGIQCGENCSKAMLDLAKGFVSFSGLETYIPLDNTDGRRIRDVVGQRSGTFRGDPSQVDGIWGKALRFPNQSDGFTAGIGEPLEASDSWTLVLWLRVEIAGWHTICGIANADGVLDDAEVEIGLAGHPWEEGAMYIRQEGGFTGNVAGMGVRVVSNESWNHVAVVYGGRRSGKLLFYLNGTLAYALDGVRLNASAKELTCGGSLSTSYPTNASRANGFLDLDELRWYNLPLSSEDVLSLASAADGGVGDRDLRPGAPIGITLKSANLPPRTKNPSHFMEVHHGGFAAAKNPPRFSVAPGGGTWERTNRGVTKAEIMTNKPQRLKVCWERGGAATQAGILDFTNPAYLQELGIWLTQREWNKPAPFVVSFKTGSSKSDQGLRYTNSQGTMSLSITFLNLRALRHLGGSAHGPTVTSLNPESDDPEEASQIVCGIIFRELWSSNPAAGFPMPKGCYYKRLSDNMRELIIIFEKKNGLSPDTSYQIVMNGRGTVNYARNSEIIFLSSNDAEEGYRYSALEIGHVFTGENAEDLFVLGAGSNDPQFGEGDRGLEMLGENGGNLVTLKDQRSRLRFRFMGGEYSTAKISRGDMLNFWMQPLTAWQLPEECGDRTDASKPQDAIRIHCFVIVGNFRRCGEVRFCRGKKVVPYGPQVPRIEIVMPPNMNDLFGENVYQMDLYNLNLPYSGVLPHKVMMQLSKDDDTRPNFREAAFSFYSSPTREFATLARLMTSSQQGLEPFEQVHNHVLYVKMQLPVPLRGFDRTRIVPDQRPPSIVKVNAPQGFKILGVVPIPHGEAGLDMVTLTPDGDAASRLNSSVKQTTPTGFGSPDIRGWSFDHTRTATYSLLDRMLIPASTSLVFGFRVYTGNRSLPITNTLNLWSLQVLSPGDHNQTYTNFSSLFYRTGLGGVPVLARLKDALIQPSNPMLSLSDDNPIIQSMSVFFKAVETVSAGGMVDVEAPQSFDFLETCNVRDLDDQYYVTGPEIVLHRLPDILRCESLHRDATKSGSRNLLRLYVNGPIKGTHHYGFNITVMSPTAENLTKAVGPDAGWYEVDWNITTRGPEGSPVASTFGGAAGAADGSGSWRLVNKTVPPYSSIGDALASGKAAVAIGLSSWLPFTMTKIAAAATVVIKLEDSFLGALEVSAPVGFEWLPALLHKKPRAPWNETATFAELPTNVSSASQRAMLRFDSALFESQVLYGFEAPIYVPDFGPVTSNPTFVFSFQVATPRGPSFPEGMSSVVFAEPVRAVVDSLARASNELPGSTADLLLQIRFATAVANPAWIEVMMPLGYKPAASGSCNMRPWPGQFDFSSDSPLRSAHCHFQEGKVIQYRGTTFRRYSIILRPSVNHPLVPGILQWRVSVINPETSLDGYVAAPSNERFGRNVWYFITRTHEDFIDAPQAVESQPPPDEMAIGGAMDRWPPGRNDRPGQNSQMIFQFSIGTRGGFVKGQPMPAGVLEIIGPVGTIFPTRCYSKMETRVIYLFGSVFNATKAGVDVWDLGSPVTQCEGRREIVLISIAAGLIATKTYAFRIDFRTPFVQPIENNWTLSFLGHFSRPQPAYRLWAFSELAVSAYAQNSGPSCYMNVCVGAGRYVPIPVHLQFRTQNSIKTNGELHITAPVEFAFNATPGEELVGKDRPTRCILREYEDGNMSAVPYVWRLQERECLIMDKGSPIDGSGTGDLRTVRIIVRYKKNEFDTRPPKELHPRHIFTLDLWLQPPSTFRPAEDWALESFDANRRELDIGAVNGWEVLRVLTAFEHSNTGGVNKYTMTTPPAVTAGLAFVPNFVIDFVLPANAWQQDQLVLTGPEGFLLQIQHMAPFSPGSCIPRRMILPQKIAALEPEATRTTSCSGSAMRIPLSNFGRSLQSGQLNRILIDLVNPESPPVPEKNFWKLEHFAGGGSQTLQTSAVQNSWQVIPVLFNVGSGIIGEFRAAGSSTTVYFDYQNVQASSELQIDALVPKGFLFQNAFATANISGRASVPQILTRTYDMIRMVVLVERYDWVHLVISNIVLSKIPGLTQWHLTTWELPEDDMLGTPILRDQVFMQGFLLPGLLQVTKVSGQTGREAAAILGQDSNLTFTLQSSAAIPAGSDLQLQVKGAGHYGFKLFTEAAELWIMNEDGLAEQGKIGEWFCKNSSNSTMGTNIRDSGYVPHTTTCQDDTARAQLIDSFNWSSNISAIPRLADRIALRLFQACPPNRLMRLKFQVRTPQDRTNFLLERFHISFTLWMENQSVEELISTNDGASVPLSVVQQLPTKPDPIPSHVSPLTTIEVEFRLDQLDSGAEAFALTAPLGYTFVPPYIVPPRVNNTNNPKEIRAMPMPDSESGRSRVRLDCDAVRSGPFFIAGLGTECLRRVPTILFAQAPSKTPARIENEWFVEAIDVIGENYSSVGDRLGRGTLDGFELVNMDVSVLYGALASVPVDIAINFVQRVDVPAGGTIHVVAPEYLQSFGCVNERGTVQPIDFKISDCVSTTDPPRVTLTLNHTLRAGVHGMIVPGKTPSTDPKAQFNTFDFYLRGPDGKNKDVSLGVQGEPVTQGLRLSVWPMWWTQLIFSSDYFTVTVPMEIIDDVNIPVHAVLVEFPKMPDFQLYSDKVEIHTAFGSKVQVRSDGIVSRKGGTNVLVKLDKNSRMRPGLTLIRFQITATTELPLINFWRVGLCGDKYRENDAEDTGCWIEADNLRGRGDALLAIFCLAGFNPWNEGTDQGFVAPQTGGALRGFMQIPTLALVLWVALRLCCECT